MREEHDEFEASAAEDAPSDGDPIGQALEELEEIGDPELEAMGERILERPAGWKIGLGTLVVLVIAGSALFGWVMRSAISKLPRIPEEDARGLAQHIADTRELPPHRRRASVGRALAQIEHDRLPEPLVHAMIDGGAQAEHTRLSELRRALSHEEVRPLWQPLCPPDVELDDFADEPRSGARVYQLCGLHGLGLLSVSDVVTSRAAEVLAAHAIFRHLKEHDALTDVEVQALRAFARGTVMATPATPFR